MMENKNKLRARAVIREIAREHPDVLQMPLEKLMLAGCPFLENEKFKCRMYKKEIELFFYERQKIKKWNEAMGQPS